MRKEQFENLKPGDQVIITIKGFNEASTRQEKIWNTTCGATLFERGSRYVHLKETEGRYFTIETKGELALWDGVEKQPMVKIRMPKGKTIGEEQEAAYKRVALRTIADELNELVEK